MDIKEVIQYIAEQDLEINLTLQVGSSASEDLKTEIQQLRRRIDELQMNGDVQISEDGETTVPAEKNLTEYDYGEYESEDADMSEETEEKVEEVAEDFEEDFDENFEVEEQPEEEKNKETMQEAVSNEETISSLANEESGDGEPETEEEDKFDEMFGGDDEEDVPTPSERRTPEDPLEEEPTEEERSEAGADFEELFGEV